MDDNDAVTPAQPDPRDEAAATAARHTQEPADAHTAPDRSAEYAAHRAAWDALLEAEANEAREQ